jgi:hypothetical protein
MLVRVAPISHPVGRAPEVTLVTGVTPELRWARLACCFSCLRTLAECWDMAALQTGWDRGKTLNMIADVTTPQALSTAAPVRVNPWRWNAERPPLHPVHQIA